MSLKPGSSIRHFGVAVAIAVAGLFVSQTACADAPLLSAAGTTGPALNTYTLGYQLTTGSQPLIVDSLGLYDSGADGLTASHDVGLWNADGSVLLGKVTVPAGTGATLINSYRYADLALPVTLLPNTTYEIGAAYNSDDGYNYFAGFGNFANNHVNGGVTIGFGESVAGSTLTFPDGSASAVYTGPNLLYSVPEPASLVLVPLISTFGFRRRRVGT